MARRALVLILCGGSILLVSACATKTFVQEQVSASEDKLSQQMTAGQTEQEVNSEKHSLEEDDPTEDSGVRMQYAERDRYLSWCRFLVWRPCRYGHR